MSENEPAIYVRRNPGGRGEPGGRTFSVEIFGEYFGLTRKELRQLKEEIERELKKKKP